MKCLPNAVASYDGDTGESADIDEIATRPASADMSQRPQQGPRYIQLSIMRKTERLTAT